MGICPTIIFYLKDIMKAFIAQGIVLSHVACHNERRRASERLNKPIEEIPLMFGSVRMAINKIQLDGQVFDIDKSSTVSSIKEQRLILEISYKFDYKNVAPGELAGPIIEEHSVVEDMKVNHRYSLHMTDSRVNNKHYMKLINPSAGNAIKSYFLKAWADDINFLDEPSLTSSQLTVSPQEIVKGFNLNPQLVIA